jgi:hypothetical protein
MSVRRSIFVLGAFLLAATAQVTFSQSARADGGYLWLASVYAAPVNQISHTPRWKRVSRPKPSASFAVNRVAQPSRPRPLVVASAAPVRSECFWCNVRVTGLSF